MKHPQFKPEFIKRIEDGVNQITKTYNVKVEVDTKDDFFVFHVTELGGPVNSIELAEAFEAVHPAISLGSFMPADHGLILLYEDIEEEMA